MAFGFSFFFFLKKKKTFKADGTFCVYLNRYNKRGRGASTRPELFTAATGVGGKETFLADIFTEFFCFDDFHKGTMIDRPTRAIICPDYVMSGELLPPGLGCLSLVTRRQTDS